MYVRKPHMKGSENGFDVILQKWLSQSFCGWAKYLAQLPTGLRAQSETNKPRRTEHSKQYDWSSVVSEPGESKWELKLSPTNFHFLPVSQTCSNTPSH